VLIQVDCAVVEVVIRKPTNSNNMLRVPQNLLIGPSIGLNNVACNVEVKCNITDTQIPHKAHQEAHQEACQEAHQETCQEACQEAHQEACQEAHQETCQEAHQEACQTDNQKEKQELHQEVDQEKQSTEDIKEEEKTISTVYVAEVQQLGVEDKKKKVLLIGMPPTDILQIKTQEDLHIYNLEAIRKISKMMGITLPKICSRVQMIRIIGLKLESESDDRVISLSVPQ
jgi:membrane-bound lytic murein transglycosylase